MYSVSGVSPVAVTVRFVRPVAVPAGKEKVSPPPVTTYHACASVAAAPGALRSAANVAPSALTAGISESPTKTKVSEIVVSPAHSMETVCDQLTVPSFVV